MGDELGDDAATIAFELLRAARRIAARVDSHSRATARGAGLTIPQLLCLKALGEDAETTAVALARRLDLTPATVTGILDRLEDAGLLVRVRRDDDRRKLRLDLSEAGRAKLSALPAPLDDGFIERLFALPAGRRRELLAALVEVADLMDAPTDPAAPGDSGEGGAA